MTSPDQFAVNGIGLTVTVVVVMLLLVAIAAWPEYRRRRRLRRPFTHLPPADDPRLRNFYGIQIYRRKRAQFDRYFSA